MKFIDQADADWIQNVLYGSPKALEDTILSICQKRYVMDVVKLDDLLHKKHGYEEDQHGSMRDFIIKKFGTGGLKRIMNLLNLKIQSK